MIKNLATAWLVGYFVCLAPIYYVISVPPLSALIQGIIGVGGALIIEGCLFLMERDAKYDY